MIALLGLALAAVAAPAKQSRDAVGPLPYTYETENFAVRWGSWEGFGDADVAALAAALEAAWALEIDELGWPAPYGTDTWRFNVYIGDTDGAPSGLGASGYYDRDDEGFPMLVIAAGIVTDHEWTALTATHELLHAVQDGIGSYTWDRDSAGAWYWEATAVWVEGVAFPDVADTAAFLPAFAYRPALPLDWFQVYDGSTESLHMYGAAVWLEHLADHVGGPELVRRTWTEAPADGDPLEVVADLLAEDGHTLDDVFGDFAARNATWDYAREPIFEAVIDAEGGWDAPDSRRPTGQVLTTTSGWVAPADEDAPMGFGANYWRLSRLADPTTITIAFDDDGPWRAWLAAQEGDVHTRTPVPIAGGVGSLTASGLSGADEVWLVIARTGGGEAASYRLSVTSDAAADGDEAPTGRACGCDGAGGSFAGVWLVSLAAIARRSARSR